LANGLWGAVFGFAILILPYAAGGMGAGDVKFLAAIGAWLGLEPMFAVALVGCLATGAYAVVLTIATGRLRQNWLNFKVIVYRLTRLGHHLWTGDETETVQAMARQPDRKRRLIPISAMMAVGAVVSIIWKSWAN
jgi:prepilin peptidase CpaA